jgi:hypothetical protein
MICDHDGSRGSITPRSLGCLGLFDSCKTRIGPFELRLGNANGAGNHARELDCRNLAEWVKWRENRHALVFCEGVLIHE